VDDARRWSKRLASYHRPSPARSVVETLVTVIPFAALWALAAVALAHGQWWGLALTVPAAAFLVRLFILQHDCGHGALFPRRAANDWVGRALGVLTFTPYDYWRRTHAVHHATAGNLDKRGIGRRPDAHGRGVPGAAAPGADQVLALPPSRRDVRPGAGLAVLVPVPLPLGLMRSGRGPWASALATNLGIVLPAALLIWVMGLGPFLLVQLPDHPDGGHGGVWLFYVQHQFETTHWAEDEDWEFGHARLHGSSNYELPAALRWFTGNIGIHHVHHLSSRIPFYRLPQVLADNPELAEIGRVTLWESLQGVRLVLWDERARRLISFREARRPPERARSGRGTLAPPAPRLRLAQDKARGSCPGPPGRPRPAARPPLRGTRALRRSPPAKPVRDHPRGPPLGVLPVRAGPADCVGRPPRHDP
jgi:omega-6 fatty acid desaturase (delta-12 desaturase)